MLFFSLYFVVQISDIICPRLTLSSLGEEKATFKQKPSRFGIFKMMTHHHAVQKAGKGHVEIRLQQSFHLVSVTQRDAADSSLPPFLRPNRLLQMLNILVQFGISCCPKSPPKYPIASCKPLGSLTSTQPGNFENPCDNCTSGTELGSTSKGVGVEWGVGREDSST